MLHNWQLYCCNVVKLAIADVACLMFCYPLDRLIKTGLQERSAPFENPAVDRRRGGSFEKENATHCVMFTSSGTGISRQLHASYIVHVVHAKAACVVLLLS